MSAGATILSLQWTLLRRRIGRGAGPWLGILLSLLFFVTLAAWYGAATGIAVSALRRRGEADMAVLFLGLFYSGLIGLWMLTPVLSLASGPEAFVDPDAYQVYPVRRRTLFALSLVSAAVQPWAWPLYAALLSGSVVLAVSGAGLPAAAAATRVAILGIVWSAGVSSALHALTRTRRIREWIAVFGALALAVIFYLPNLIAGLEDVLRDAGAETATGVHLGVSAIRWAPTWLEARWVLGLSGGTAATAAHAFAAALGFALAYGAFRWALGRPEATRARKGVGHVSWIARLLTRVRGPTGLLVVKELAYIARDPHLRLAVGVPLVLWTLFVLSRVFEGRAAFLLLALTTLSAASQAGMNLLGRDRAAFEAFLAAPLRGSQILFAKALAHFALFLLPFLALVLVVLGLRAVPVTWVILVGGGSTAATLLLLAGGQRFSVFSPYPLDPRHRMAGPGGGTILLLMLFELGVLVVVSVPIGLPYLLWGAPGGVAGSVLAILAGWIAVRWASERYGQVLEARREEIRWLLRART